MKNSNIIRKYKDEKILMLLSYLETLPNNSRFIIRLMYASTVCLIQLKHHGLIANDLISLLKYGKPQLEDPQEVMFTQQVGSPYGSFTVFPGNFMFYQNNLTRLLYIAQVCGLNKKRLSIVYFFLHISQMLAERTNAARYDGGKPGEPDVYIPDEEEINKEIESVFIQEECMNELCVEYGISCDIFNMLLCTAKRKDLRKDMECLGYSDRVTLSPFYRYNGGYIILHPSALLHCAYYFCKGLIQKAIGEKRLLELMNISILNEIGCILNSDSGAHNVGNDRVSDTDFLLYAIDSLHSISIIPVVAEKKNNQTEDLKLIEQYVIDKYKNRSIILHIVIYTQIEDSTFHLMLPKGNVLALNIDDFTAVMSHKKMTLRNLYYYTLDKQDFMVPPMNQEIDLLSCYIDNDFTFYQENKADVIFSEIGSALPLRTDYYTVQDIRYIDYPLLNRKVPVHHFGDIPKGIPIYAPLYAPDDFKFLMVGLGSFHLFFVPDMTIKGGKLFYEICHSIALWLYAAHKKKELEIIDKDLVVVVKHGEKYSIETTENEKVFKLEMDLHSVEKIDPNDGEEFLLQHFVSLLKKFGLVNMDVSEELLHSLFTESHGHFLTMGKPNPMLFNDGVDSCYFVNDRWADKILNEIAHKVNFRDEEVKLSLEESKKEMRLVLSYLQKEADEILQHFDSKRMLENALKLHHAMIYWSRLTQARFKEIQNAYRYIDSDFTGQNEFLNQYAEMNVLSQGIIEHIVLNDMRFNIDSKAYDIIQLDRFFAILHHISNMGTCFDSLNMGLSGSELTILANGRIAMPTDNISLENKYFSVLRSRAMNYPDLLRKQSRVLEKYEVDYNNDKEFIKAFQVEYGITFDLYCDCISKSIEFSNVKKTPVVSITKDDFLNNVLPKMTERQVNGFFDNFVLSKNINKEELRFPDKLLQRYNRATQITTRPWIEYDRTVFFSSKALYNNFAILTEKINNGTLRHSSREMETFLGRVNENKGHQFTMGLKEWYKSLSDEDIIIESEVPIQPNKLLAGDKNYGDIDLLLINEKLKKIVCIESKDYFEARTGYDLLDQDRKIVKALSKVEDRDKWCKEHVLLFKNYSSLVEDSYQVKTWYVTYNEPAYRYVNHANPSPIEMLSSFEIIQNPYCVFN